MFLLVLAVAVAAVAAGIFFVLSRPTARRPGEALPDITDNLARDVAAGAPEPLLVDITGEVGLGDFRTFVGPRTSQLPEDMGPGAAWGDFDNDGDDDLFLVSAGGSLDRPSGEWAPSRLYENRGDGTFRPFEAFPEVRISGMAAAWGDADGDGWLDLVVTGYRSLLLFHNEAGRAFVPAAGFPGFDASDGYWAGATWGDFDNDRDLDLYVCGYVQYREVDGIASRAGSRSSSQYGAAVPFTLNPASFEPERNLLLRNDGAGHFEDVAPLYGVSNPEGRSLGARWHDLDDDGRLDLYVANDISDNALFLNRGDTFEDAGLAARVADYRGAMGIAVGDWNRDGDDDLFVTHWVAQENALYDSRLRDTDGDRLTFSDVSARLGLGAIALPFVGWGTEFLDFDADGRLDLVVANGSTFEDDGEPPRLEPQAPHLFWNRDGEFFDDLAPRNPTLAENHVGRGLAVTDFDQDGDTDLLLVHLGEGVQLLRNDMPQGHWLQLALASRNAAGQHHGRGEGSTVVVRAGGVAYRRTVGASSYLSQSSAVLHIGLGAVDRIDTAEVHWLGGAVENFGPLAVDAAWELREGEGEGRRRSASAAPPDKEQIVAFWQAQRAAMDAIKRDRDIPRAIALLRRALELDPGHQDSRYYLANCLAAQGEAQEALAELDRLRRQNPASQRAHRQWAVLRARSAASPAHLTAALAAAERAVEINQEETGSLLLLAELALLTGDAPRAEEVLTLVNRTNPRAVGGFFLRAYLAHRRGDEAAAIELLRAAHAARGPEWKPEGTVAEGDVEARMHRDMSPLADSWRAWDGTVDPTDPGTAFVELERALARYAGLE